MYDPIDHHAHPEFHTPAPQEAPAADPQVVWLDGQPAAEETAAKQADPYDVINFLLKKVDEQQARLTEQEGYIELQQQELDQVKGQLDAARSELEAQLADYEVLMQNTLAVERELESQKQKAQERPSISLPFYTEQKLAKLGYAPAGEALEERQAV